MIWYDFVSIVMSCIVNLKKLKFSFLYDVIIISSVIIVMFVNRSCEYRFTFIEYLIVYIIIGFSVFSICMNVMFKYMYVVFDVYSDIVNSVVIGVIFVAYIFFVIFLFVGISFSVCMIMNVMME